MTRNLTESEALNEIRNVMRRFVNDYYNDRDEEDPIMDIAVILNRAGIEILP